MNILFINSLFVVVIQIYFNNIINCNSVHVRTHYFAHKIIISLVVKQTSVKNK